VGHPGDRATRWSPPKETTMPTRKKTAQRSKQVRTPRRTTRATRQAPARRQDAVAMLKADHAKVEEMFGRFENLRGGDRKEKLVAQICSELEVHAQLEEEIFYPAVRAAIGDDDLMDEATVEHQGAKDLIAQLKEMSADEKLYDAKVTVLSEYIKHHVKEEHTEMFPKARRSDVDLMELGEQMRARKDEITGAPVGRLKRMFS
jgi:hemerythrin superfamily protein